MKFIHNSMSLAALREETLNACARKMIQPAKLLSLLLLLALPVAAPADYSYTNGFGIWAYTPTNGPVTITGFTGSGKVTIPNTINHYPVVAIRDGAFYSQTTLTGVIIPDNIATIGVFAFYGCSGLTSVTIGNSVASIGEAAFEACSGLTSLTIPDNVTSLGDAAFEACSGLTSVTLGNGVTTIGDWAFDQCSGLTNVALGNHVASIGRHAFEACFGLTRVTVPGSVTNIGTGAFAECSGLHQAYFLGNAPSVDGGAGSADNTVFYDDTGTAYYLTGATGWGSTFGGWPVAMTSSANPWPGATDLGGGWERSSWFGDFNVNGYPWIYHAQHGWLYVFGTDPASVWVYSPAMGFLWTSSDVYPWLWSDTQQTWLYYDVGSSNPRYFYNWNQQKWTTVNP